MRLLAGSGLTLAFLALVAPMLWSAFGLSRVSGWVPLSVLSATLVLLLLQLAVELLAARRAQSPPQRPGAAAAWIGVLLLLSWLLGVVAGSALFCAAWLRWHARLRWSASLTQAAGLGFVLWLVFAQLLGSGLYVGLLAQLLR